MASEDEEELIEAKFRWASLTSAKMKEHAAVTLGAANPSPAAHRKEREKGKDRDNWLLRLSAARMGSFGHAWAFCASGPGALKATSPGALL